jgi:hypothetical protein
MYFIPFNVMSTQPTTSPAQHAAGPWYLDSTGKTELEFGYAQGMIRIVSADHRLIGSLELSKFDMFDKKRRGIDPRWDAEQAANARLIAAAPDLLKACEQACDWFSEDDEESSRAMFLAISHAIGKATMPSAEAEGLPRE